MTQCISKDYLFDHVIDVECGDGTYQEAVLLEDIYDAPTVDAVEVVKCICCRFNGECKIYGIYGTEDGFEHIEYCSFGKRVTP